MQSFFIECEELHEALVDALQSMSDGESDSETINIAFRAVHSIKGGAGAFGLESLVSFAHQFETVMDGLRSGEIAQDDRLVDLFFRCGDQLSDLIRASRDSEPVDQETSEALIAELSSWVGDPAESGTEIEEAPDFQPMTLDLGEIAGLPDLPSPDLDVTTEISASAGLRVLFHPEPELYESGNEPLFLLRALADLGHCETTLEFAPPSSLDTSNGAGGRISWTIDIETDVPSANVQEIFEFAEGLCKLEVTALSKPSSGSAEAACSSFMDVSPTEIDKTPAIAPGEPAGEIETPARMSEETNESPKPSPTMVQPPPPQAETATSAGASASANSKGGQTVRVDLERIDRLVNLVGELVINQAMLSQSIAEGNIAPNSPVSAGLDEFLQLTRDIQESVMMIRAQPVKSLFQRMSRIVRESSTAVGKSVRLVTDGEYTEIDKTAIERLADPLTHMIRNAVDHGLESTEKRRAAGKSDQGEIRLKASHKSGRVVIEISDDGGGINREKVHSIAISKGLVTEDAVLSDSEIDQLLFLPGFSTAEEISNLSGRGVGMDVVKTQITALGGRVTIESTPGVGTTFAISLPLTLAVLDGMVITVAGETLVLPLNAIVETLSLSTHSLRPVSHGQYVLPVRDQFVPVLDLGARLGYRSQSEYSDGSIALLISPEEGSLAALLVDTIEDQRQVVIKGLQDSYGHVPGVAAATILGDGQIALILDPVDLVHNATGDDSPTLHREAS